MLARCPRGGNDEIRVDFSGSAHCADARRGERRSRRGRRTHQGVQRYRPDRALGAATPRTSRKTDVPSALTRNLVRLAPLGLLVLAGCAGRDDLYVLLPGKGKTGALTVTSGGEQRVLDQPYAAARVTRTGSVDARVTTEAEVRRAFGPALAAQPGRPVSFYLYFLADTDEFTLGAKQVVNQIFADVSRRPAPAT